MSKTQRFDRSKLSGRHVTDGPSRAPHRSYFHAVGITEQEIHQPRVGVATCRNEAAPCNIALHRQALSVKMGVKKGGVTPREFTTITVTDGIAMGHEGMRSSLASRDALADTVELTMRGHCYDALVGLAGCDKSLPGRMMAMVRLNVPSVLMDGGSILPGRYKGRDITVQGMSEAVGRVQAGTMSEAEPEIVERTACPASHASGAQYTANIMACVSEATGLALLNSSGAKAPCESRVQYGEASGVPVTHLIEKTFCAPARAQDAVTRKSLENAARVVACTGGSTNAALHLPAIAHEAGIDFDLFDVAGIMRDTPYFVDPAPGGKYLARDRHEVGGVAVVMKELMKPGLMQEDGITASGKTIGGSPDEIVGDADGRVIPSISTPITGTGGVVGRGGNTAPDGASRFGGVTRGFCHVGPEAAHGGPIATLRNGDMMTLNALTAELSVALSDDEPAARKAEWQGPPQTQDETGAVLTFARLVGGARWGAVTHPGAKAERHVCMDR